MNISNPYVKTHHFADLLIRDGMRIPLVHSLTGISWRPLRELCETVHGAEQPLGRMRNNTISYITHGGQSHSMLSTVVSIYLVAEKENPTQIEAFLKAWDAAKLCADEKTPIDINAAWFSVRDYKAGLISFCTCKGCDANYIFDAKETRKKSACPFCGDNAHRMLESQCV